VRARNLYRRKAFVVPQVLPAPWHQRQKPSGNLNENGVSQLNFRVQKAFHREFAIFAITLDKSRPELLFEAFELLNKREERACGGTQHEAGLAIAPPRRHGRVIW
jgi:hypothetical protein